MNKQKEPEAYVIGSIPFIHTEIYLDSHPLIPRTETEYWVFEAIKEIRESGTKEPKILDLCAGSGCIGVAVLKELTDARVDFAEIDTLHHSTIEKNIRENGLDASRSNIFGGDLFENIRGSYDFILANPPYIDPRLRDRVQESVIQYEPGKALYGGKGGLEIIERILSQVEAHLNKGGMLYLEHEPEQTEKLSRHPFYIDSSKDQFGISRFSRFQACL